MSYPARSEGLVNIVYKSWRLQLRATRRPHFQYLQHRCVGVTLFLSLDCSTLPAIRTLYPRVLSKEVSSTIFKVFDMTQPGIEPRSPGTLANTLPTRPMSRSNDNYICLIYENNLKCLTFGGKS